MKKHKRTPTVNFSYSMIHKDKCNAEESPKSKPYEFYCTKCLAVLCIKCVELHKSKDKDHEIRYIDEFLNKHYDKEVETVINTIKL